MASVKKPIKVTKSPPKETVSKTPVIPADQKIISENTEKKNRLDNLKPFKPGVSGNPAGRPTKDPMTTLMKQILEEDVVSISGQKATMMEALVRTGLNKALKGDFRFFKEIMERIEGKVIQRTDLTTGGQPLQGDLDLSKLSKKELDQLEQLYKKNN